MKICLICKASTEIGFGHLIRSRTLATSIYKSFKEISVELIVIGKNNLNKLLIGSEYKYQVLFSEEDLKISEKYDIVFLDMMEMQITTMLKIKQLTQLLVCISPVFNQMKEIDVFFNRTKYYQFLDQQTPKAIYAGLEYAFVQENCMKINAGVYEDNLNSINFPIAISMGGGDAANKTLQFLKTLKKCKVPATFWVMLGEGYQHSYND